MTKPYSITLTNNELGHLAWLVNHGYYPQLAYDDLTLRDGEPEEDAEGFTNDTPRVWEMSEHAAWSIAELRQSDPHALYACTGGPLLEKLNQFEAQIV